MNQTMKLAVVAVGLVSVAGCFENVPRRRTVAAPPLRPAPPPMVVVEPPPPPLQMAEEWIQLPFELTFRAGSVELDADAEAMVAEVAEALRAQNVIRLRVEGHADSRGRRRTNERLSLERAQNVVSRLAALGVDPRSLEATGHGSNQRVESDRRSAGRRQNRRVEFRGLVRRPVGGPRASGPSNPPPGGAVF